MGKPTAFKPAELASKSAAELDNLQSQWQKQADNPNMGIGRGTWIGAKAVMFGGLCRSVLASATLAINGGLKEIYSATKDAIKNGKSHPDLSDALMKKAKVAGIVGYVGLAAGIIGSAVRMVKKRHHILAEEAENNVAIIEAEKVHRAQAAGVSPEDVAALRAAQASGLAQGDASAKVLASRENAQAASVTL